MLNIFTIWVCFLSYFTLADYNETGRLVGVIMIFRHGDRVIISPYPTDPYKNSSYWPAGWGQLTNLGKLQHYELGSWFRKRYRDLLPIEYSEQDIYVRSTDVDRTLMSAEANLAGLYPPRGRQIWDTDIPWQPIPIHTIPEYEDNLLAMKKQCPKYDLLIGKLLNSPEIKEILLKNKDLMDYVAENAGTPITNFEQFEFVYNTLNIEKNNNFTLPEWTHNVFPDKMKSLASFSFAISCYTDEMARLKTGLLFNEITDHMYKVTESIKNNNNTKKIWMYSGHDVTIANVLQSLRIFEYHNPPYASTILFEIRHKNDQNFIVNVLYKNTSDPRKMVLNGCDYDCPLDDFVKILDKLSLGEDEWENECKLSILTMVESANKEQLLIVAGVLLLCLFVFVVLVIIIYSKYNKTEAVYLRLPDDDEHV